jgi:hypothetical protein
MIKAENIEKLIEKLHDTTSNEMDERVLKDVLHALAESQKTTTLTRRTIMKSPITKLAAAAVIILAAVLSISIWNKSMPTAYALDQTIKANHSVRYIHIKDFTPDKNEPKEFWIEFYEDGKVKNARMNFPQWNSPEDGAKAVIWKEGKATVWFKKKNSLLVIREERIAKELLKMIEELDPKLAVERLSEKEKQGLVKIDIQQPSEKAKPIIVTATYSPESQSPNKRLVLSVDQATKLVMAIKFYQLKNDTYEPSNLMEFHEYNQPIEEKLFSLDNEVPADAMRIDQTTQEVGLVQGQLSDEEIAVEVARQFFEALIAEDYAKAGKLLEGTPAEKMKEMFGRFKFLRIISIGPAGPHPNPATKGLVVSCTVEIEKDGRKEQLKLDRLGVRQVYNQPGRWTIFGGI